VRTRGFGSFLALVCVALPAPVPAGTDGPAWGAEAEYRRVQKLDATAHGGPDIPKKLSHARLRSNRELLNGTLLAVPGLELTASAGAADLTVHLNEGETRHFSPAPAYGGAARARLFAIPGCPARVCATGRYLAFDARRGAITAGHDTAGFHSWDSVAVRWSEIEGGLELALELRGLTLHTGARYLHVSAREEGLYRGERMEGRLAPEGRGIGFAAEVECAVRGRVSARAGVSVPDGTTFHAAAGCRF
jgi:hypothetical protein